MVQEAPLPTEESVLAALRKVVDRERGVDIVTAGMVSGVVVKGSTPVLS